jgi:ubiquinone/menaquinone biosynthesis C-methylase UbiE
MDSNPTPSLILAHYATGYEKARLEKGTGQLERARTEEILSRILPSPPADVLDVGGGPGSYAGWLGSQGYKVELLDIVPLHVEQAREYFDRLGLHNARAQVGDARQLPYNSRSQDVALLLGPLYHLIAKEDRLGALREASRVLRPGGHVVVAGISRFASLMDGFFRGFIRDPSFAAIATVDLDTGRHENQTKDTNYFTTAYFHRPAELADELADAGFTDVEVLAVEGPFWCLQNFEDFWSEAELREQMLGFLRRIESEASLLGSSAHLLGLGRMAG